MKKMPMKYFRAASFRRFLGTTCQFELGFLRDVGYFKSRFLMLKKLFVGMSGLLRPDSLNCKKIRQFVSSIRMVPRNPDPINRPFSLRGRLASHAALLLLALVPVNDAFAQIQIVNCNAPVQSRKRGIAVNSNMSAADFQALAPGVSWFYDWGINNWTVPSGVAMNYIPMVWSDYSGYQSAISSYLGAGNRPWRVFAVNEPNLKGQAFMTPAATATAFLQVKAICDPYNIPVICPAHGGCHRREPKYYRV